jgi:dipeptidyl aminopeptidase/acylaminoacyl peptidase
VQVHMEAGRKVLLEIIVWSLYCTTASRGVLAQSVAPLLPEDVVKGTLISELSPIGLSPNGKLLAYVVREPERIRSGDELDLEGFIRTGVSARNQATDIWVTNIDTRKTWNLTAKTGSNFAPSWSPDGRYLAFLSDRDGSGQTKLWVWDSLEDDLRLLSGSCVRAVALVNDLKWTPDSKNVLATIIPAGLSVEDYIRTVLSSDQEKNGVTPMAPQSSVALYQSRRPEPRGRDAGDKSTISLDPDYLHDLVSVNVLTGQSTLVAGGRIGWYAVSPDGLWVGYTQPKRVVDNATWPKLASDLVIVSLRTSQRTVLANDVIINAFSWSPTSSAIGYGAYSADGRSYDYYVADIWDRSAKKMTSLASIGLGPCCGSPAWDRQGKTFYFILDGALWRASVAEKREVELARIPQREIRFRMWSTDNLLWTGEDGKWTVVIAHDDRQKRDGFYRIDLHTGESTKLIEANNCYTCKWARDLNSYILGASIPGGRTAFVSENSGRAPDLWVADADFHDSQQVTHLNPQFDKYKMGTSRVIDWLSDDGEPLHGALLLPSTYQSDEKYPLIVWTYPASKESNQQSEFGFGDLLGPLNMQLYATRGYAVLFADSRTEVGKPGDGLTKSVLPGVSKVVEMGIADSQRVAVIGQSNGGYAALALITRTKRFKAAVELAGYADFIASYGVMQMDGSSSRFVTVENYLGKGGPWQNALRYVEASPLFRLERVETPLLMVHGAKDEEIAPFLADELFDDMRFLGKEVEYARYGSGGHVPSDWSLPDQLDLARRVIAWFDVHLKAN